MSLDIIIYAIIAVVLLVRLWAVFGRRNDEDRERPNPFAAPQPRPQQKEQEAALLDHVRAVEGLRLLQPLQAAPASLAGGLEQIKGLDPSFDEKQFLQGARQAFSMIIEDFSKGDMVRIGRLMGPQVSAHFQSAIDTRRQSGQIMESKIIRIKDVECVGARTEGNKAFLTVRFVSEQDNTLRDRGGQVIGGTAGVVGEITDVWVFTRDTTSSDPNWQLTETRS